MCCCPMTVAIIAIVVVNTERKDLLLDFFLEQAYDHPSYEGIPLFAHLWQ